MAGHPEKNFENKVKSYLTSMGAWWYKTMGTACTRAGVPDILAVYKGRMIALEIKADRGRPSALQLREIEMIRKAGGYARILYPKDFESFKADMEELRDVQSEETIERGTEGFLPDARHDSGQRGKNRRAEGSE